MLYSLVAGAWLAASMPNEIYVRVSSQRPGAAYQGLMRTRYLFIQ
jgi:hypothetical protein